LVNLTVLNFSLLSSFFYLCHRQQQRRLNLLPHAAADVAIAVKTFEEEEVGIIVLLEEMLLLIGELPVVANVAVGDRDNLMMILREEKSIEQRFDRIVLALVIQQLRQWFSGILKKLKPTSRNTTFPLWKALAFSMILWRSRSTTQLI
jgi:hypothetical protein